MPSVLYPANAIAWAHFQRRGGARATFATAGGLTGVLALAIFVTAHLNPNHPDVAYASWSMGLMGLQALFLVVFASARLAQMIRADVTTGMIESHRMMPLPDRHAIAGYLVATAMQSSGMFLAILGLGAVTTTLAQLPPTRWLGANFILLAFAVFTWTISAALAFQAKNNQQAGGIGGAAGFLGFLGNGGLLQICPGIVVLTGPLIGGSIFNMRAAQTDFSIPLIMSVCCQIMVGSIFFVAACRKYRRPEALATGAWLAAALLGSFVLISILAIVRWEEFQPGYMSRGMWQRNPEVPFIGSCCLCMLIAILPLCNFARVHTDQSRQRRTDDPRARRTVPHPFLAGLILIATLACLLAAAPGGVVRDARVLYTLAALAGLCMSVIFLCAWVYRIIESAKHFVLVWLILYGLLPIAADVARHGMSDDPSDVLLQTAATFSPFGLLIETWGDFSTDPRAGAAFQLLVPLLPAALYLRQTRKAAAATHRTQPTPAPAGSGTATTSNV